MHSPLYPWLHAEFARFHALRTQGRMPHALLVTGEAGLGQGQLAFHLAQAILCHHPLGDSRACGHCVACRPFLAGAHPDFSLLAPKEKEGRDDKTGKDKKERDIKVDAVREFCANLNLSSSFQHGKVGIIEPADAMNAAAANSLLKTLEEPPAGTLIVLVTPQPARLPITIRSRCQRWQVAIPERAVALEWLQRQPQLAGENPGRLLDLAEGRPLEALAMAEPERLIQRSRWLESVLHVMRAKGNPASLAASQDKNEWPILLHWSRLLLVDLIRLHQLGQVKGVEQAGCSIVNQDYADVLAPLALRLHTRGLFDLYDYALEASRLVDHPLNRELLIEDILIRFQRLGGHT